MQIPTPRERLGTCLADRYRLDRILAVGGMGVLFGGVHVVSGRSVAIKLLKPADALDLEKDARLLQEARIAAGLQHPNMVTLLDCGRDGSGAAYLVMELLQGLSLEDELRLHHRLSVEQALAIVVPVMGALAFAHDWGVVHRDVKPSNIFLSMMGSQVIPKLLDFGIATATERTTLATATGVVLGTPEYMAPEQVLGEAAGRQSDVWSMGVVLYRCLSGSLPFSGSTATVLHQITHESPKPLTSVAADVPPRLAAAVHRALARAPEQRYGNMREFAHAVLCTAVAQGTVAPTDPDPLGLPEWKVWREGAAAASERTLDAMVRMTPRAGLHAPKLAVSIGLAAALAAALLSLTTSPNGDLVARSSRSPGSFVESNRPVPSFGLILAPTPPPTAIPRSAQQNPRTGAPAAVDGGAAVLSDTAPRLQAKSTKRTKDRMRGSQSSANILAVNDRQKVAPATEAPASEPASAMEPEEAAAPAAPVSELMAW